MFNSKIKGFFFSFVTVALLGILVTSCEREVITTELNDNISLMDDSSKIPAAPSVEGTTELSDNIESRGCVKNGCNNYVTSVNFNQVTGYASAGQTITVWYYNGWGVPFAYEQFTIQIAGNCSFSFSLNPPSGNNVCNISAFVGNHCGIRWLDNTIC